MFSNRRRRTSVRTVFRLREKSLFFDGPDLWIDSMRSRERCYVSHGHADHAREHQTVVATPNTAAICRARFPRRTARPGRAVRAPVTFEEHAFNEPWEESGHRLTLFSAGHVLGSAQLLVEGEAGRFVYTGDFKLAPSLTVEPPEVKRCDVVLMECTFGRPQYVFPSRDEIAGEMAVFARAALEADCIPVFYAYSLGKAQEAIAMLGTAGVPLTVHHTVDMISRVYRERGVALPAYETYDESTFSGERALVWPPSGKTLPTKMGGRPLRTAMLTGWALDHSARFRYGVERGFPLSDHADYPALLRYIELAAPRKVLLNHGWRDFVHRLRHLGIDAEYLEDHPQLSLF